MWDPKALTLDAVGGEEGDVPRLQGVVVGAVGGARLGLRLPGQRGVVHLGGRVPGIWGNSRDFGWNSRDLKKKISRIFWGVFPGFLF